MGETFHLFSTDPVVRRALQRAHELRNAYLRAALIRLLRGCVLWLTPPQAIFGKIAAIDQRVRSASVEGIEPSTIASLTASETRRCAPVSRR
jgi:hypothetical protein